jgi:hypothetical protein
LAKVHNSKNGIIPDEGGFGHHVFWPLAEAAATSIIDLLNAT